MLKAGKTPEELIREINDATREIRKEEEAAVRRQKELDTKREAAINALNDYIGAVYGKKMSVNDLKELSTEFQAIEKMTAELENTSVQFTRDEQEKKERGLRTKSGIIDESINDEEKIRNFVRAVLGE